MLTIIVSGRNDDYGKDFRERLFRTALHNASLLSAEGIDFEFLLAEWNPLADRAPLSEEFVSTIPNSRAIIIPAEVHQQYSLNPAMPFHEMPAKNAALRRAKGDVVIVTNADILFGEALVSRVARGGWSNRTLYRAHRIDVNAELDWEQIQNPANQLLSGEGRLCPPYYMGAGGDFCLAKRSLWHALRGFNELVRFSTRAKDWQFFLSASADGINIEFIGDVYHLDHEEGFRNTAVEKRTTNAVHFGGWWDIEFGLPVMNSTKWGFADLCESLWDDQGRISILSHDYHITDEQNAQDRNMMTSLTHPPNLPAGEAAFLLHAICAAHRQRRRLICRLTDPGLLTVLSGFAVVAARFSIDIRCNSSMPSGPGYTHRSFDPETVAPGASDWLLEEADGRLVLSDYTTGEKLQVLPAVFKVNNPDFNPVLTRRLLYAYLRLQENGSKTIAIYGCGSHTTQLLTWGIPDNLRLIECFEELPSAVKADAVLLSSASFESDMLDRCKRERIQNAVALYSDWPKEMWEAGIPA